MFFDYLRLIVAIFATLAALSVALNRHHALLGMFSRLTDRAAAARPRPGRLRIRRPKQVEVEEGAGSGTWVSSRGKQTGSLDSSVDDLLDDEDEDELDWLDDDD